MFPGQKGSKLERPWVGSRLDVPVKQQGNQHGWSRVSEEGSVGDEVRVAVGFYGRVVVVSRSDKVLQALWGLWSLFWIWWEATDGIWAVPYCAWWIHRIGQGWHTYQLGGHYSSLMRVEYIGPGFGTGCAGSLDKGMRGRKMSSDISGIWLEQPEGQGTRETTAGAVGFFWWKGMEWWWGNHVDPWVWDAYLTFKWRYPKSSWIYWATIQDSG